MSKALGLISGGLDSTLAALTLKQQGVDVTGIVFVTPFFGAARARQAARQIDMPLIVEEIGEIHLDVLKNPRYGYGKNLNPCIDCHALMFRLAARHIHNGEYDFLFSGEVLGQRPMSQNFNALQAVAKHADCADIILRPLCAKLLPVTPMEEKGLVDREQLLDIQGRSRKRQEQYARQWGLTEYPGSGGGCLLTEKSFTGKLRDLLDHQPDCTVHDVELLKLGRQFRLSNSAKLTLGRDQQGNEALQAALRPEYTLLHATGFRGPTGLVSGTPTEADLNLAAAIVAGYGKGREEASVCVRLQQNDTERIMEVAPLSQDRIILLQIL
ncbi:thiamin biosynthesis protein ThiI-related adenine nucleotide alpha hydrolase superfamily protein [Syntrophotalea carbinolica DSM 2380]|uniref:Thiamin biosynthesis protein ThiI-related adenine nucleotide alpha hydrolase superfamily protein n=1 Tax=Syntrophotalea carbinolica (strain DSM 2380 / NBRC 103641 / GraBd1) TaxID=338963 RepID=Q3A0V3_SYNC1|nr:thiamine biosynthesis protein [Syntrophotalea carbinolica]ABA90004.1 thiamin biosynthesis protein ThiI-related adenine nucleotide alpha hydrolase superfamily protein [Syntrophotalea carbinolica DSM 2380]